MNIGQHELDEDLPINLEDQYFLPNNKVSNEALVLLRGDINRAYMNWLKDAIETNQIN